MEVHLLARTARVDLGCKHGPVDHRSADQSAVRRQRGSRHERAEAVGAEDLEQRAAIEDEYLFAQHRAWYRVRDA